MDYLEEVVSQQIGSHLLEENTPSVAAQEVFEKQMGVDEVTLQKVIATAMSLGGDFADLFFEYTLRNSILLEEGIIKNSSKAVIMGVGIRVLKGEQTGYGYSEDLTLVSMLRAARTAASIASDSRVKFHEAERFNETVPANYYKIAHSITDLVIDEKIRLLQEIERTAHNHDSRIIKVSATLADSIKFVQIATSEGNIVRDTRPMFRMSVQCIAQEGENIQTGFSGAGGRVGTHFLEAANQAETIGKKAASQAILLLGAHQAPSGAMPVILGPAQSGILLHEAVGHPIEADFNRKGTSAYSGRIGEKVASELCTIYDSGQIENDRGALNFDDEGNPSSENKIGRAHV